MLYRVSKRQLTCAKENQLTFKIIVAADIHTMIKNSTSLELTTIAFPVPTSMTDHATETYLQKYDASQMISIELNLTLLKTR